MSDITLTSAPVTWRVANLIQGATARGANGYVEFEAEAVAVHHGGLTWLPSPQRAEMVDGTLAPISLPINDPDIWNWRVTPRLGVVWEPFHVNVEEGGTDLASAAIVPGKGPVKVVQGPAGASVVDFRDTGDGALVLILSDGTESPPVPFTRGPAGPPNKIEIGTVIRGDEAYASLSGAAPNQRLNLTLPKGDPGNPEDLIDATPEQRGLMSANDKAHLDDTPTRAEVVESTERTLTVTNSVADNFEAITPRYVTRLEMRGNNTTQGLGRDSMGRWYVTQVYGPSANRDVSITRLDAGGRQLDTSIWKQGGHGAGLGFEEINGDVWIWIWWNTEGEGKKNVLRRWKYVPGRTVQPNDSSVQVMPDYFSNVPGFVGVNLAINQRLDLFAIAVRTTTDTTVDTVQLRRLSEYKAGIDNVIAQLPPISLSANGAFQGIVVTMEHCYIHRGMSGAWPQSPHIDQYRWSDGKRIGQKDLSHLPYQGAADGGKAEAEGMIAEYDSAGRMALTFNIETGASGANIHNLWTIEPKDYQADAGVGASLQRLYAPLRWVDVPLASGHAYRSDSYKLQVAKDASGMVHLRGHMSTQGFPSPLTSAETFATVPLEYRPESEVRFLGFRSGLPSLTVGGYISASTGDMVLQADSNNSEGPRPNGHFALITQPWQAKS